MLRHYAGGMDDDDQTPPTPASAAAPEPAPPERSPVRSPVRSEEALARSKDEVTPRFKEPKAPKKPSRWAPGRKVGGR